MPDAIWIDQPAALEALALTLKAQSNIGIDTEFLRERTFFPKLCLLQIAAGGAVWCVDTLRLANLDELIQALTNPGTRKVIHAARQDLEAVYLNSKRVISPVFDTQIAAGCVGLKPQVGYAELVKTLLDVTLAKGQTRTDWSKRPLTREQLDYAADDVLYLGEVAEHLDNRLGELGRRHWVLEDCAALEDPLIYEPDPALAWMKLKGLRQLDPKTRARARVIAVWREKAARERNLPRSWIMPDADIFNLAHSDATTLPEGAASLRDALRDQMEATLTDNEPSQDARPTPEQRAVADRLAKIVDRRAAELHLSAESLAPRGELKALAMGERDSNALRGWRRKEIGESLLAAIGN
jgi:ribonuclease D